MTYSVFAVDANAISPSGCAAYTYTLNGFLPYLRAPWYQFSEQANDDISTNGDQNPAFPFLTGHGGANQVAPFGFLGLRTDQPVLFINPSLPPQIPYLQLRTIYFGGAAISASMNSTHTNLTRLSTEHLPYLTDLYANTSMPIILGTPGSAAETQVNYSLTVNTTLTVPNRRYFTNLTYPGNMIQCLPVTSADAYADGQFPAAVNDGATATRWQPKTNASASLVVNMTTVPFARLAAMYFDWGVRPPRNATVFLGNETVLGADGEVVLVGGEWEIAVDGIQIDEPDVSDGAGGSEVRPYVGNSTSVVLGDVAWTGGYARLVVEGCWVDDGVGATVGEWVLVGA